MTKPRIGSLRRAGIAALAAAVLVPLTLFAQANDANKDAREGKIAYSTQAPKAARAACEQAKRDAWFLRQMQITDGNHDPFVELPIGQDCVAFFAAEKAKGDAAKSYAQSGAR